MALDYKLIGSGVPAPVNLVDAFRTGLAARNDMLTNQQAQQNILATQFANNRAPIVAMQNDALYAQNLALKQAQEQQSLNEIQLAKQKADRDFYDQSLTRVGQRLNAVQNEADIPVALQVLQAESDNGQIHPKVYGNLASMVANKPLTVEGAKYLGLTALSLKDQIDRENQMRDDLRAQQKQDQDQKNWVKTFGLDQSKFKETVRNNKEQNAIGWANASRTAEKDANTEKKIDFSNAMKVRDEYNKPLTAFEEVRKNYYQLVNLGNLKDNPKAKMSVVYSFMKMLDPGSTVRESEYASARDASGIQNKMQLYLDKAARGDAITDRDVKEVIDAVKSVYEYAVNKHQYVQNEYKALMKNNGIDANKAQLRFYDKSGNPVSESVNGESTSYKKGDIVPDPDTGKKYMMIGSDPEDPASWKEVQ